MSTINAQNYGDGTDSVPASAVLEGTAKYNYDYFQSTPEIRASYNVSSITDNSTGNHTANFTNAFQGSPNPTVSAVSTQSGTATFSNNNLTSITQLTTNNSNTFVDTFTNCAGFGDLA